MANDLDGGAVKLVFREVERHVVPSCRLTNLKSTLLPDSLEVPTNKQKEGAAAMKDQATQYLALDVHQSTTVATVRNHKGGVELRATVPTEGHALVQLVRAAGPRVHVAFEEG